MKKHFLLAALALSQTTFAQVAGNAAYQNNVRLPDNNISVTVSSDATVVASVRALANVKADSYVAVFSVTQTGKTAEDATDVLDRRLAQALTDIRAKSAVESYVDMISFVPTYEYEVDKKIFSKRSYNEVPTGFELKKNLHLKYSSPEQLPVIIATLARAEIYDIVRVDYVSEKLEQVKKDLATKGRTMLSEKLKAYEALLGTTFPPTAKRLAEGYRVFMPAEMYKSYEAYSSTPVNIKKSGYVNEAAKSTTLYSQPILNKEFDFVVNTAILEPVIQVLYEVKIMVEDEIGADKKVRILTPAGELKTVDLGGN